MERFLEATTRITMCYRKNYKVQNSVQIEQLQQTFSNEWSAELEEFVGQIYYVFKTNFQQYAIQNLIVMEVGD